MEREEKISAGEFKAICLSLMDEVNKIGRSMTITKRNIPVARLVPVEKKVRPLFGRMQGKLVLLKKS